MAGNREKGPGGPSGYRRAPAPDGDVSKGGGPEGLYTHNKGGCRLPPVGDPPSREELFKREELSNLYMRGVKEGYEGELFGRQAEAMRDILDVFGEDGLRVYLMGVIEGEEDAKEEEADALGDEAP
jgi:hypothetical protein